MDLREPMFTMSSSPYMRAGFCLVREGDEMVYAGPIRDAPDISEGCELILHPKDFASLDRWFKKHQH